MIMYYNLNKLLLVFLAVISLGFFGCKKNPVDPDFNKSLNISSKETGIEYTISVKLPDDYYTSNYSYPSLYVLDAEEIEDHVSKICNETSKDLNEQNVIVIG